MDVFMPSANAVGGERGRGRLFSLASTRHYRLRMTSIVIGTGCSQLARAPRTLALWQD